jgi:hypothetical protein
LSSDHTPIIATISTTVLPRKPKPILHTSKTNWELFRQIIEANTTLTTKLKDPADIENDYKHFIALLQEAAKRATPTYYPAQTHNIPLRIKTNCRAEKSKIQLAEDSLSRKQSKIQSPQQQTKTPTARFKERLFRKIYRKPHQTRQSYLETNTEQKKTNTSCLPNT